MLRNNGYERSAYRVAIEKKASTDELKAARENVRRQNYRLVKVAILALLGVMGVTTPPTAISVTLFGFGIQMAFIFFGITIALDSWYDSKYQRSFNGGRNGVSKTSSHTDSSSDLVLHSNKE